MDWWVGDIGGPLLGAFAPGGDVSEGMPQLDVVVGVLSFVDEEAECGMDQRPGVYTRVSSFLEWANAKVCIRIEGQPHNTNRLLK